jgi:uncharacterized membrane protein
MTEINLEIIFKLPFKGIFNIFMFLVKSFVQVFIFERIFFEVWLNIGRAFDTRHSSLIFRYL